MSDIESFIDALQADPDEVFVIERDGKPVAVLISMERSRQLDAWRHIVHHSPGDPAAPCNDRGRRASYGTSTGYPLCILAKGHDGPHRAHESWGEVTW